ncbi:MAG: HlyD family secretion protein [Planctomycetota bacterium]|jgi:multidrug resistance efflux pump
MKMPGAHRAGNLRLHILPILVWLGAVGGVVLLLSYRTQRFEVLGLAQGQVRQISSTSMGRLKNVPVQLFEPVKEGDVVAIIDTVLDHKHLEVELEAKKAVFLAEIRQLQAELKATHNRLTVEAENRENDMVDAQRRFYVDVVNARLRTLELKAVLEPERIRLDELELNAKILTARGASQQNSTILYEQRKLKKQYDALAIKIQQNQRLLTQAENDLQQAIERRDKFALRQPSNPTMDTVLAPIREAINIKQEQIGEILTDRVALELRSPFDGIVSEIQRKSGEAVLAGEPILTISETKPIEILAYADQKLASRLQENMKVKLLKSSEPPQIASSQITHLGPGVQLIPEQLRKDPAVPEWGRPMLIKVPPDMKLMPGEIVGIKGL